MTSPLVTAVPVHDVKAAVAALAAQLGDLSAKVDGLSQAQAPDPAAFAAAVERLLAAKLAA